MKQRKHYDELSVMSGMAILFVLAIHGCGSALGAFHPNGATYAQSGLWLRTLSNFAAPAVPMFLFISGFKYSANDTQTPYFVFLKKRFPRVLMSFTIINTFYWFLDTIKYSESFDVILLAKTYLHSWMGYSVAYQLWYIPMYCFVTALCPLVRYIIPTTSVRFCVHAVIGITQRVLEVFCPLLATYPIRFISYPVFFEMGILVHERDWGNRVSKSLGLFGGMVYYLLVLGFSACFPVLSANNLVKYVLFYFFGTAVMYALSAAIKTCRILLWLGTISYPVFLLHEPLIGRSLSAVLRGWSIQFELAWAFVWIALDLLISVFVMFSLARIRLDRVLWKFKL